MMEFQIYLMKHNKKLKGNLRKFLEKNLPLQAFKEEQKRLNKNHEEAMNLDYIDQLIA